MKTKRRGKKRHRVLIAQYLGAKHTHSESTSSQPHCKLLHVNDDESRRRRHGYTDDDRPEISGRR
jgi:hypothetical protein